MEMRTARVMGMSALLVLTGLGCNKLSKDSSKVIVSVNGDKITEKAFAELVQNMAQDPAKAKDLLTNEAMREQRNNLLEQVATQRAVIKFAKAEGVDKDPKIMAAVENATAMAYFQAMAERRASKAEPTEAELKAFYDEIAAQGKAAGSPGDLPPFETVKAQLPAAWKRKQTQNATEGLLAAVRQKVPMTFAPEYKASRSK